MTIWKFPLEITDVQTVAMPVFATILSVQFQGDTLCLWALVDPKKTPSPRKIRIVGTGNPVDQTATAWDFIGTVQQPNAPLVWHVFES